MSAPLPKERVCLLFVISQSAICSICCIFNSARAFWKPCSMSYTSSSQWRSPDADREIKHKIENQSERASSNTEQMFTAMLTFCLPLSLVLPSSGKVSDGSGNNTERREEEETRRKGEGGAVGRTKWKKCWQAGCWMAGKWDSHTAVFLRRGTPKIGVTVFHCHGE